jgi:hypothetical protein
MTHECPREHEVVAAVLGCRWEAVDQELKMHAAGCEICHDIVAVAGVMSSDREHARHDVRVPAAGQVWWRAAVRARLEAAHAAARPLTWLHGIAGACAIGLAIAVAGIAWPTILEGVNWLTVRTLGADSSGVGDVAALVTAAVQRSLPLAFVVAAFIVLAPVALYFVLADEK